MNRKEQIDFIRALDLEPEDVTNKKEIEQAQHELDQEAARRGMRVPPEVEERLRSGVYEITDHKAVKKAYRKAAMKHHPDKGGDPERFKEIHHAYKMLTDPSFVLQEVKSKTKGQPNLDAVFNVTFTFEQAFFGDEITLTFNPIHLDDNGKPVIINKDKDIYLEGDVFKIRIPEGTTNGAQKKIEKKGLIQGERQGDFVINFQVQPHHKFQLQGSDIHTTEKIPLELMLTGGELDIPTMWGIKTLVIPPGSKPHDVVQVLKAGVAKVGHHCVSIDPQYPDKQELKDKDVWKKLGIKWEKYEEERETTDFDKVYEELLKNTGATGLSDEADSSDRWDTDL